ncbi:MAG: CPBP family intramembrane metalloprotease [Phycisphaeraceae bacterium]|nr:CPBP family intramembrane metalloprotease [Phycisphaeraceae bacterium]
MQSPATPSESSNRTALLALALLVPAPSIGAAFLLIVLPDTIAGMAIYLLSKAWILALPLAWLILVDRERPHFLRLTRDGQWAGHLSGVVIVLAMLVAFVLCRDLIDQDAFRARAAKTGLDARSAYLATFAYIILVNSLLEEYVFRWYVTSRFEQLLGRERRIAAALLSGACFTLHHIVALYAWVSPSLSTLALVGVFIGGTTWSWLYARYHVIWPAYVSHVWADVAVMVMGWHVLFHGS